MTNISEAGTAQIPGPSPRFDAVFDPETAIEQEEMATPIHSTKALRYEFEEFLRSHLIASHKQHLAAAEACRGLLEKRPCGAAPDHDGALALAYQMESQTLIEYTRALGAFTDLVVHGISQTVRFNGDSESV